MRMIDDDRQHTVRKVGLLLSVEEAKGLIRELSDLLEDPEANRHFHLPFHSPDPKHREISGCIVTETKLTSPSWTKVERQILDED